MKYESRIGKLMWKRIDIESDKTKLYLVGNDKLMDKITKEQYEELELPLWGFK